jgi:NAD(P)-dependent dehydrogenase (short-subunit alcohol dehydrogenase family)
LEDGVRRATVTGASSGLGRECVDALRGVGDIDEVAAVDGATYDGDADVLVLAAIDEELLVARPFVDVDPELWERVWEASMRAMVASLQSVLPGMRDRGWGRVVVVTPTASMSGVAGLAPLCAVVEAQRVLAKSTARQWGAHGITVNCLAPGEPGSAGALAPPALTGPADVGGVLRFLVSDASAHVTGATLCVDGGVWMAP